MNLAVRPLCNCLGGGPLNFVGVAVSSCGKQSCSFLFGLLTLVAGRKNLV